MVQRDATSDEDHETLINNRQNGRRGRGRGNGGGGMRPMNGGGQERGNRIDNRARGNANQLHEKYKTLARDAQTSGDRVMTEYYLQFADHYFRVLNESRSRFEEQQQRRPQAGWQEDFDGEEGDGQAASDYPNEQGGADREPRYQDRQDGRRGENRQPRDQRHERYDAANGETQRGAEQTYAADGGEEQREERREPARREEGENRPRRGRPRRDYADATPAGLDAERLPAFLVAPGETQAAPSPAASGNAEQAQEEQPRRRRTRRPRADEAGAPVEV